MTRGEPGAIVLKLDVREIVLGDIENSLHHVSFEEPASAIMDDGDKISDVMSSIFPQKHPAAHPILSH